MTAGPSITGLSEFGTALANEIEATRKRAKLAVKKAGQAYANDVKVIAPYKTGTLRRSIHVEEPGFLEDVVSGEKPYVYVGTDLPYARRLEFGFWGMRDRRGYLYFQYPRPYFRPPLDTQMEKYIAIMEGTLQPGMFESYRSVKTAEWAALKTGFGNIRPDLLEGAGFAMGILNQNMEAGEFG